MKPNIIFEFGLESDLFWNPLGEREIEAVAEHGFSFLEIWATNPWFDVHSPSMAAELKAMVEARGLRIHSVHAPCDGDWDISSEDEAVRKRSVEEVILSIERCREMGGEFVVAHPGRKRDSKAPDAEAEHDRHLERSIEGFKAVMDAARDNGILLAIENQWEDYVGGGEKHFLRFLDTLDPHVAGICFDSSHANITPGTHDMIRRIKHPIIATHLSDNDGDYDMHRPPFTGSVDWEEVLRLLLEKGYRGPWLIECLNGGNDPFDVLAQMGESIVKMRAMLEELSRE